MNRLRSWSDFERRQDPVPRQPVPGTLSDEEIVAQIFLGSGGEDFLRILYRTYVDRRTPAGASDALVREMEAQRRVVADLEKMRDRGIELIAAKKKAPSA